MISSIIQAFSFKIRPNVNNLEKKREKSMISLTPKQSKRFFVYY